VFGRKRAPCHGLQDIPHGFRKPFFHILDAGGSSVNAAEGKLLRHLVLAKRLIGRIVDEVRVGIDLDLPEADRHGAREGVALVVLSEDEPDPRGRRAGRGHAGHRGRDLRDNARSSS
jgi:hypothetical protein